MTSLFAGLVLVVMLLNALFGIVVVRIPDFSYCSVSSQRTLILYISVGIIFIVCVVAACKMFLTLNHKARRLLSTGSPNVWLFGSFSMVVDSIVSVAIVHSHITNECFTQVWPAIALLLIAYVFLITGVTVSMAMLLKVRVELVRDSDVEILLQDTGANPPEPVEPMPSEMLQEEEEDGWVNIPL
ncbi:hypothetical protein FPV67DRAFT_1682594 [Lyophyllum atratum]|nr:hypothetical protein FPV67DRAFT_1682594 [Lyophyllum atratum]